MGLEDVVVAIVLADEDVRMVVGVGEAEVVLDGALSKNTALVICLLTAPPKPATFK